MSKAKPLHSVELKAMQATARDGITEMFLGGMLLVFSWLFSLETPLAVFGALFPLILNPLGKFLKRKFVYPRIGYAKVSRQPHAFRNIGFAAVGFIVFILASLGVFALILGFEPGYSLWLSHFVPAVAGLMMAIGPWVVARTYRLAHWYILAALFVLGGICLPLFNVATGYTAVFLETAIVGGLSLVFGIGLFVTFLRKYPKGEVAHVAE
jgi:hypothetical protein